MMRLRYLIHCIILAVGISVSARAQQQPVVPDTAQALPRLDIPEITIVGKKAITLPFARKGEIYDVDIYKAPPPDSSLLTDRPTITLPVGNLPRYDEPLVPWHSSLEGMFGSFTTGKLRVYSEYNNGRWGLSGFGGYRGTRGHVDNSSGSALDLNIAGRSLISTDNDVLGNLRAGGLLQFMHDSYGRFGHRFGDSLQMTGGDRTRNALTILTSFGSVDTVNSGIDVRLGAEVWSVTDSNSGNNGNVSSVSPILQASYFLPVGTGKIAAAFSFKSSSLDYQQTNSKYLYPQQSPSLLTLSGSGEWLLSPQWNISLGARFDQGNDDAGATHTQLLPIASLAWQLDRDRQVTFWYRPEMTLASYGSRTKENPYLDREIDLRPERSPLRLGTDFWFNGDLFSIELTASVSHTNDRAITVAGYTNPLDTASTILREHRLQLDYVDANDARFEARGTFRGLEKTTVTFYGRIDPSTESGKTIQLPMVPLAAFGGILEYAGISQCTVSASVDYTSKQNIDRAGAETIGDRILFGCGISSSVLPRTTLTFDIANLFNTSYEWWGGYIAPGRALTLNAKVNLR